jgi:hypothetical protein
MKIKMLRTENGSPDGLRVRLYEEGMAEDVADELALAFIGMGAAEAANDSAEIETQEGAAPAMETPEAPARRGRKAKA